MTPTRSIYDFDNGHVHVTLTFTTPALPSNLTTLSRPVTYDSWDVHAVDIYTYLNTTSARTPRSDLYQVNDVASSGFTAGSVVGGPFIRLMDDPTTWAKYDTQDTTKLTGWAPLPTETAIRPTGSSWKDTTATPAANRTTPGFNPGSWATGTAGFGTAGTRGPREHDLEYR